MRSRMLFLLFTLGTVGSIEARDNYVTSPAAPYPPGCVDSDITDISLATPSSGRQTYIDDDIPLTDAKGGSDAITPIQIYRRGCIEDDRSLLFLFIESVSLNRLIAVPKVFLVDGETRHPMRLVPEGNTFEADHTGLILPSGSYRFLVDGPAETLITENTPILSPERYNANVTMIIQDSLDAENEFSIPLPLWNGSIAPRRYPLNGRLSGVWVVEGAADQGFVISFNELLQNEGGVRQQVFFSWYTFDQDGGLLWLTSSGEHELNASELELPIQLVTNGEFLGGKTADRETIGTAVLRAQSCNELTLQYGLDELGLGSSEITLVRAFSLEIAGYACRDVEARLATK